MQGSSPEVSSAGEAPEIRELGEKDDRPHVVFGGSTKGIGGLLQYHRRRLSGMRTMANENGL